MASLKECQLHVLPIMDRSQKGHTRTHFLVKVEGLGSPESATAKSLAQASTKALDLDKQIQEHAGDARVKDATHTVTIG